MKKLFIILSIIFSCSIFAQYNQEISIYDALQSASDIKVEGIRIMKNFLYKNLKSKLIEKEADKNTAQGEFALLQLEIYSESFPSMKNSLDKVGKSWKKNRGIFINKTKYKKEKLYTFLVNYIKDTDNLITDIKNTDKTKISHNQQTAQKLEILSQELNLLYALDIMGIKNPDIKLEIAYRMNDFQKKLKDIYYSGENTISISELLKSIQSDWLLSKKIIVTGKQKQLLKVLFVLMNKISEETRKVSLLYQEMSLSSQ